MSETVYADQLQQKELPKEAEVYTRLEELQTWTVQEEGASAQVVEPGAYREEVIRQQVAINQAMQEGAQRRTPAVKATVKAARGEPAQEQAPAQLTYKQRREQERKLKKARKGTARGTIESYELHEKMNAYLRGRGNSLKGYESKIDEQGSDKRIIRVFCDGYQKTALGRPATQEDRLRRDQDAKFIEDYISNDLKRREPHLEYFRRQLMDYPVSYDTISDANILQNADEIYKIANRAYYYENMRKDPINAAYFARLSPEELAVMDKKMKLLSDIGTYLTAKAQSLGVETMYGIYIEKPPADIEMMVGMQYNALKENMTSTFSECVDAVLPAVKERMQSERKKIVERLEHDEQVRRLSEWDEHPVEFTSPPTGYIMDQIRELRQMILDKPEIYAQYQETLEHLYQDAYRTLDLINELNIESMVCEGAKDHYEFECEDQSQYLNRVREAAASREASKCQEKQENLVRHMGGISDAFRFYLKGRELTEPTRLMLEEMGHGDEAGELVRQRAAQAASGEA